MASSGGMPPPSAPPGQSSGSNSSGGPASSTALYSEKIKLNVKRSERLKRNVLEIGIETNGEFKLVESDVAKLISRIGIDLSCHVEGFQILSRKLQEDPDMAEGYS